jgi:hypothetical protein
MRRVADGGREACAEQEERGERADGGGVDDGEVGVERERPVGAPTVPERVQRRCELLGCGGGTHRPSAERLVHGEPHDERMLERDVEEARQRDTHSLARGESCGSDEGRLPGPP